MNYKTIKTRPGYLVSVSVPCSGEEHELGLRPDGRWIKIGHNAHARLQPQELALEKLADYAERKDPDDGCARFLTDWRRWVGRSTSIPPKGLNDLSLMRILSGIEGLKRSRGYNMAGRPSTDRSSQKKADLARRFRGAVTARVREALRVDSTPTVPWHGEVIEQTGLVFNVLRWMRVARSLPIELVARETSMMFDCTEMGTWRGFRLVCVTFLRCLNVRCSLRDGGVMYGPHDITITYALIEPSGGVYATGSSPKPLKTGWLLAKSQDREQV